MARYIDFKELREQIKIEDLLNQYSLLSTMNHDKNGWKGNCPFTDKESKSKPFKVNTTKNLWKCFCSDCKTKKRKGGNTLDFIMAMESCEIREAAEKAITWLGLESKPVNVSEKIDFKSKPTQTPARNEAGEPARKNQALNFKLKDLEINHSYFKKLRLSQFGVEYFGLGFYSGKGIMKNRIVIPFHDSEGKLVAYIGRDPKGEKPDLYPKDFNPDLEIYNLHNIKGKIVERIIVHFNFQPVWFYYPEMRTPRIFLPNNKVTPEQIKLLKKVFPQKPALDIYGHSEISEQELKDAIYAFAKKYFAVSYYKHIPKKS